MAIRIASRAPSRPLSLLNGCQKAFARQFSCSPPARASREYAPKLTMRPSDIARQRTKARSGARSKYRSPEPNPVEVVVDGKTHQLSPLLLRDLCQCTQCVDPSTRQKHFATVDIRYQIRPKTVEQDETHVRVTWHHDLPGQDGRHTTSIPMSTIRNILVSGKPVQHRKPVPRSYWNVQTYNEETRDFDYESYMNDDSVLFTALQQLETHGLMFLTNVPESEDSVETVASRIGPLKTTFYGKTWDVRSVPEAKNVAYTSQNLGFHMDLMYMKQPPHLQLLHCIRSSAAGGASLFSDSFKAVKDIAEQQPEHFQTLSRIPATYHYDHADHYYCQFRPVVEQAGKRIGPTPIRDWMDFDFYRRKGTTTLPDLHPMDFVEHVAWSPPFQGPFALQSISNDSNAEAHLNQHIRAWYTAARVFNDMVHRPEVVYERMMKPGECVIFDNRRVLHARRAFEVGDAGKERWLRGAYIDKDPFMSKLKVMADSRSRIEESPRRTTSEVEAEEYFAAAAAS